MLLSEVAALLRKQRIRTTSSTRQQSQQANQVHFDQHCPQDDFDAIQQLAGWCEQFSPCVGWEWTPPLASLVLDVTHSAPHLGGEEALIQSMADQFQAKGYRVSIAIADTLGAAWAVAHCATGVDLPPSWRSTPDTPDSSSGNALLEDPPQPTSETWVVPLGKLDSALRPLPITGLRLDPGTVDLLHSLGIHTIDQLLALPRVGLRSRFGDSLLLRIDQALGLVAETFPTYHPAPTFAADHALEHPITDRKALTTCLHTLIKEVCQQLQDHDHGAIQTECELTFTDRSCSTLLVGLFKPSFEAPHLCRLWSLQLEQRTIPRPVQQVRFYVTSAAPIGDQQLDLLGELRTDVSQQIAYLADRLATRLGRDSVLGSRLRCEPQVDRAFDYYPLTGQHPTRRISTAAARRHHAAAGMRPLSICQPIRIHIGPAAKVRAQHRPPATFGYAGRNHSIRSFVGPERIETGWWGGRGIRRDYYQVEDQRGFRFWLFEDLRNHHWYLHGSFD